LANPDPARLLANSPFLGCILQKNATGQPCHCQAAVFRRSNLLGKAAGCCRAKPILSLLQEAPLAVTLMQLAEQLHRLKI
jgi:hypothetical protein